MHAQRGDLERLQEALAAQWQIGALACDLAVLQALQPALRAGAWKVTVAIEAGERLTGIWPGFVERAFGLAIDVGSTTIAGHLCDLQSGEVLASGGLMNPQIRFGEDLMSRVSYAMMNPGGALEMTAAVRGALRALIEEVTGEAGVDPAELLTLTAVGNPIMHHLLLGIDPSELGTAPFALASDQALTLARERARAGRASRRPRLSSCPASPAMSAPTPRA